MGQFMSQRDDTVRTGRHDDSPIEQRYSQCLAATAFRPPIAEIRNANENLRLALQAPVKALDGLFALAQIRQNLGTVARGCFRLDKDSALEPLKAKAPGAEQGAAARNIRYREQHDTNRQCDARQQEFYDVLDHQDLPRGYRATLTPETLFFG